MKNFTQKLLLVSLTICITATYPYAQQQGNKAVTNVTNFTQVKKVNEADMKSKEISREVAMPKNGEIYIENNSRNILVKTWDQPKVKISTTVFYEEEETGNYTEDEWFENANLSLKTVGSSVKIKAGVLNSTVYAVNIYNATTNGLPALTGNGQLIHAKSSTKKTVTVYVPSGSKIDVESKYSEVTLPANIGDVNAEISNGNLDADNLGRFILRSQYAIVNIGDVKNAEIEFTGGRLTAKTIDELDLDSKYSTIELAIAKKAKIRSTNDEYEFEEVGELSGRKNYGNLRISRLLQKIELEGVNADIKIRNIISSVSLIKINDKYADIRLPLKNTKNYSIDFTGTYSAVYGNFEKKIPLSIKLVNPNNNVPGYKTDTAISTGNRISPDNKNTITTLGTLTSHTIEGITIPGVSGTITGGVFSGTLSSAKAGQLPAFANNGNMVVSGYITDSYGNAVTDNSANPASAAGLITGSVGSTYISSNKPTITTVGTLSNLTVSGAVTPAYGQINATNIPITAMNVQAYQGASSQNATVVTGIRTADSYRTPNGIISGGTYIPFNRAYAYAGENDTPSYFTATAGDGKGLTIELKCPNCMVDFK